MKILIINGPNLNMLGERQKDVYGGETLESINARLAARFKGKAELSFFQSNIEGELVTAAQRKDYDGLIVNGGAYSHYSYAIADAMRCDNRPKIEVHLSNIYARDEFRRHSVLSPAAAGVICGFGADSYFLAIEQLIKILSEK